MNQTRQITKLYSKNIKHKNLASPEKSAVTRKADKVPRAIQVKPPHGTTLLGPLALLVVSTPSPIPSNFSKLR